MIKTIATALLGAVILTLAGCAGEGLDWVGPLEGPTLPPEETPGEQHELVVSIVCPAHEPTAPNPPSLMIMQINDESGKNVIVEAVGLGDHQVKLPAGSFTMTVSGESIAAPVKTDLDVPRMGSVEVRVDVVDVGPAPLHCENLIADLGDGDSWCRLKEDGTTDFSRCVSFTFSEADDTCEVSPSHGGTFEGDSLPLTQTFDDPYYFNEWRIEEDGLLIERLIDDETGDDFTFKYRRRQ